MHRNSLAGLVAAAGLAILTAGSAMAAPVSTGLGPVDARASTSMVEQAHGCHRTRQLGPAGWHRHVGPRCVRVATPPPRQNWRNRCDTRCVGVGEFRVCKRDC